MSQQHVRLPGQRNPAIDGDPGTTVKKVLTTIKMVVRTDYGGSDADAVIARRLEEAGIRPTPEAVHGYKVGAERTRDTIRDAVAPQVDWLRRVFGL